MSEERRKNSRVSSRVRVEFLERQKPTSHTVNVSRNGIFVAGESSRADNSLVRIKLYVPPDQRGIEVFARVVWHGQTDGVDGLGVHFLELNSSDRDHWLQFVGMIERLDTGGSIEPQKAAPKPKVAPEDRRETPRTNSSFLVRFKDRESLESFVTRNLSEGGMFLSTPVLKTVGTRIQIVMVHPTSGKDFDLEAEVVRVNTEATTIEPKGMGLKFVALDQTQENAVQEFVKA